MTDSQENKSFAEMFGESFAKPEKYDPGQQIEARVVRITGDTVFLDIGGKSEGYVVKEEFLDEQGNCTVREGDTVQVYFLSSKKSEMLFTTKIGSGPGTHSHLEEAHESGIPVEGRVVKEIKGGFEIKLAGEARAFCPYSQLDLRRIENADNYLDRQFVFKITQYGEKGRNIVVSRRKILEEEKRKQKEVLRETLEVGQTVKGRITSVQKFGAFVDIGGIEGLIPVSEIGWGHVNDIYAEVEPGREVEVSVLKLDWENDRFSFSLKATLPDPWDTMQEKYTAGSMHTGKVVRLAPFGAFVSLEPGVDGLLHISELAGGRKINHPREVVGEGESVEVRINSVDKEEKRISLSLASAVKDAEEEKKQETEVRDYIRKKTEKADKSMGTLGDILKKKLDG